MSITKSTKASQPEESASGANGIYIIYHQLGINYRKAGFQQRPSFSEALERRKSLMAAAIRVGTCGGTTASRQMILEGIISQLWSESVPLSALVPASSVFTGMPPLRDANGNLIAMPFVALTSSVETTERASSGEFFYGPLRLCVVSQSYDNARKIAHAARTYFNGLDITVGNVQVLDMKPTTRQGQRGRRGFGVGSHAKFQREILRSQ